MSWKKDSAADNVAESALDEFDIDGVKIVVTRKGDEYLVYPMTCPHMEEPLSNGMCDGETITCSFHLWQWDMVSGESTGEAEIDLLKYPVKIDDGDLYVDFSETLSYD